MATAVRIAAGIAQKARRIGWQVETGNGRQDWIYRISPPGGGPRVQIHSSPSDGNWEKSCWQELNALGFEKAEAEYEAKRKADKEARLLADRKQAELKTERLVAQSQAVAKAAGIESVSLVDPAWLLTPTHVPETRRVLVSPEIAEKVRTAINKHNRQLRDKRVDYLADVIRRGDWSCTHQGGAVDSNGVLQDGQHRLKAIEVSGKTVEMLWSVGMDPANFTKIDTGSLRSARDVAYIRGETNIYTLASSAKLVIQIDTWGSAIYQRHRGYRISNERVDAFLDEHGAALRQAVVLTERIRRDITVNKAGLAAAAYLIHQRLPDGDERVTKFFHDLRLGINLGEGDPVLKLRGLLIRAKDTARQNLTSIEVAAYVIKAWNFRAKNKAVHHLVWRTASEPFPVNIFLPPPAGTEGQLTFDDEGDA